MEYKGFEIYSDAFGSWFASTGGGAIVLGPFANADEARAAVDREMEWKP